MKTKTSLLLLLVALVATLAWWQAGTPTRSAAADATAVAPAPTPADPAGVAAPGPADASAVAASNPAAQLAPGPFGDFTRWLQAFQAVQRPGATMPPAMVEEGQRLAAARKPAMRQLLREQPAEALARSLKWHEWAALPTDIQAQVERPFSATGDFSVVADCRPANDRNTPWQQHRVILADGVYDAFVYGRRAGLTTKLGVALQGIALERQVALWENPVQLLDRAEVAAVQRLLPDGNPPTRSWLTGEPLVGEPLAGLVGGKVHYFASVEELQKVSQTIAAAEARSGPHVSRIAGLDTGDGKGDKDVFDPKDFGGPIYGLTSAWTEQPKRVLGLRLAFSDAPATTPYAFADLMTQMVSSSNSVREMSFNKTWLIPAVTTQVLVLSGTKASWETNPGGADAMAVEAKNLAAAAGYNLNNYDIFVFTFPTLTRWASAAAFAQVAGPHQWVNGNWFAGVLTHEFGHNYGVVHANHWLGTVTGAGYAGHGFEHTEYGDLFDIMGSLYDTLPGNVPVYPNGHYSMFSKAVLNWIEPQEVHQAASNGTYRLRRFDNINSRVTAGGKLALKVTTSGGQDLWVGYRRNFTGSTPGAYIVWAHEPLAHRLLDATPLSASDPDVDKQDAFLPACKSFLDPSGSVRITTLGMGGAGADEYLDVAIELVPALPDYQLYTAANRLTNGLLGSYVNSSLRSRTAQENWRTTPTVTISGTRVDPTINFTGNGWGARAPVGITGGSDADWENFSVQWDGFIVVNRPTRLATRTDDGSRMWIDLDGGGSFGATQPEFINNNWGNGQGPTVGELSIFVPPGTYAIRIQYEEGNGGNSCELLAYPAVEFDLFADAGGLTNGLTGSYVNSSLRAVAAQADWRSTQPIAGTRLDAYPRFSRRRLGRPRQRGNHRWHEHQLGELLRAVGRLGAGASAGAAGHPQRRWQPDVD
jgi:hypothetical protein